MTPPRCPQADQPGRRGSPDADLRPRLPLIAEPGQRPRADDQQSGPPTAGDPMTRGSRRDSEATSLSLMWQGAPRSTRRSRFGVALGHAMTHDRSELTSAGPRVGTAGGPFVGRRAETCAFRWHNRTWSCANEHGVRASAAEIVAPRSGLPAIARSPALRRSRRRRGPCAATIDVPDFETRKPTASPAKAPNPTRAAYGAGPSRIRRAEHVASSRT